MLPIVGNSGGPPGIRGQCVFAFFLRPVPHLLRVRRASGGSPSRWLGPTPHTPLVPPPGSRNLSVVFGFFSGRCGVSRAVGYPTLAAEARRAGMSWLNQVGPFIAGLERRTSAELHEGLYIYSVRQAEKRSRIFQEIQYIRQRANGRDNPAAPVAVWRLGSRAECVAVSACEAGGFKVN